MATSKKSDATEARSIAKRAGKPQGLEPGKKSPRMAVTEPDSAHLDLRDRLKTGPRRPAGPPVAGDVPTHAAMEALRTETTPAPTDPS
ncbi:MAG: hypothetical protein RLY71_1797 [Pseudomonadota bacterium]